MQEFVSKLCKLNGHKVTIITSHKLFGNEKYKCELCLVNDEKRMGFRILSHEIYLLKSEVKSFEYLLRTYRFRDALMEINIVHT